MIGLSRTASIAPIQGLRLAAGTAPQKLGRSLVWNGDGSFNRELNLTGSEYAALALPGAGAPPGVTTQEWVTRQAVAIAQDFGLGDLKDENGTLRMLASQRVVNGQTVDTYLLFAPGEWSGTLPNVTITAAALASLPTASRPLSIASGIVVR